MKKYHITIDTDWCPDFMIEEVLDILDGTNVKCTFFVTNKSDMIKELDQDNLSELITSNDTVIVQYTATWCGNCRIMKPKFKKLASENENITFVIADAEQFPESWIMSNLDQQFTK